jgi:uncharacterized protein (DUF2267 family)
MRLTTTLRHAFVNAALADVPQVDYQEQVIKLVIADTAAQLPPKVRDLWNDPKLQDYVKQHSRYIGDCYIAVPGIVNAYQLSPHTADQVAKLAAARQAQEATLQALRVKLTGVANACTTRKALLEALPEFEKYLPASPEATCKTLPAIANVLTDFVKAGWPKDAPKLKKA